MKKIFLAILLLTGPGFAALHAQQAPTDLQQLVNQSFEHYKQIKALQTQQRIAADQTDLTKTQRMPQVHGDVSYMHLYPAPKLDFGGAAFQPFPSENVNVGVSGRQLLLDFGKSGSAIARSQAQQNLLSMQTDEAKEQLAFQVAAVYLNIAYLRNNIDVQDANIKLLEETEKIVQQRLKNGDAIDLELLNTQVKLENYRNRKIEYRNQLEKQVANMQYLTGSPDQSGIRADFSWPAAPQQMLVDTAALAENAAIKTSLEKERVAEMELKSVKRDFTPSLYLDAGTGVKNGYLPDVNTPKWNYNAGVSLAIPIYNGKRNKLQESIAAKQVEAAKWNTAGVKDNVVKEIAQQNSDIQSNRERLKTADVLLRQADRAVQLAQSRYKNGVITYLDLQNAQTSLLEAQLSKIQYQYQLSISSLELLHLNGNQFWR
ncbi:TolC family protein [Chitinophaga horti]|uniref:TolC family protein n=1 Tax=Chitinophaga horti TaxID=2920382 RepID=A0ABY6IWW4_9BACT|nr:TolC family protein [Chitinophaga horti]UYQ91872.1 TolC family protein [Chitinophaga horti]